MLWLRTIIIMFLFFCFHSEAKLFYRGGGVVGISGSIIETPCAIDTGSRDQSINMGNTTLYRVKNDNTGNYRQFSILLINCNLGRISNKKPKWQFFQIRFEGENENGLFKLRGHAKGVGIKLTDSKGNVIHPGESSLPDNIINGDQRLYYKLNLTGNGYRLHSGDYHTSIRFYLDYY